MKTPFVITTTCPVPMRKADSSSNLLFPIFTVLLAIFTVLLAILITVEQTERQPANSYIKRVTLVYANYSKK